MRNYLPLLTIGKSPERHGTGSFTGFASEKIRGIVCERGG